MRSAPTRARVGDEVATSDEERQNKLNSSEYDLTTWAARTWMSFSVQKISVAVQMASTGEIIHALGLAAAGDPRGG